MSSDSGPPPAVKLSEEAEKDREERPFRYAKYADVECSNVCGSTAGAGSGDFHQYRAIRRKNIARLDKMERDYRKADAQQQFDDNLRILNDIEQAKTERKAAKRKRKKERMKMMKKRKHDPNKFSDDGSFLEKFLKEHDQPDSKDVEMTPAEKLKELDRLEQEQHEEQEKQEEHQKQLASEDVPISPPVSKDTNDDILAKLRELEQIDEQFSSDAVQKEPTESPETDEATEQQLTAVAEIDAQFDPQPSD